MTKYCQHFSVNKNPRVETQGFTLEAAAALKVEVVATEVCLTRSKRADYPKIVRK